MELQNEIKERISAFPNGTGEVTVDLLKDIAEGRMADSQLMSRVKHELRELLLEVEDN